MNRKFTAIIGLLIFLFVYYIHGSSIVIQSTDSTWALPTAMSLAKEGNFDLNEYRKVIKGRRYYGTRDNGRARQLRKQGKKRKFHNFFPYGTSLLITPVVYVFELAPDLFKYLVPEARSEMRRRSVTSLKHGKSIKIRLVLEKAVASLIVALTSVLFFLIAVHYINPYLAVFLTLSFAFGTPLWSTASRGLWQHGPVNLLSALAIYLLIKKPNSSYLTGGIFSFAYLVRPTQALFAGLTFVYVFFKQRSQTVLYLACAIPPILLYFALNMVIWETPVSEYYQGGRLGIHKGLLEAMAANLFSPNRGLFFQSPFLLLSFFSVFLLRSKEKYLIIYCWAAFFVHYMVTSLFPNWWHGHCFGSRYMTDILPFLFLLSVLVVKKYYSHFRLFLIVPLILFSIFIHYRGANIPPVYHWNIKPVNIDEQPSRVWSLTDMQALRK